MVNETLILDFAAGNTRQLEASSSLQTGHVGSYKL